MRGTRLMVEMPGGVFGGTPAPVRLRSYGIKGLMSSKNPVFVTSQMTFVISDAS
jgi:hypothetical protein